MIGYFKNKIDNYQSLLSLRWNYFKKYIENISTKRIKILENISILIKYRMTLCSYIT